jgi:very-short-patch-repair endonuclease
MLCDSCGKELNRKPNRNCRHNFCNRKCFENWWARPIIVKCAFCGKEKRTYPYDRKLKKNFFCDKKCKAEWQKDNLIDESNPNYNNKWDSIKKKEFGVKQRKYFKKHPEKHSNYKQKRISEGQKKLYKIVKEIYPSASLLEKIETKESIRFPDIAIPKIKLDIEYDGYFQHFKPEGKEKDNERDQELLEVGWKTIRIIQKELKNPETIIHKIKEFIKERCQ